MYKCDTWLSQDEKKNIFNKMNGKLFFFLSIFGHDRAQDQLHEYIQQSVITKFILIFLGWQISRIYASHDWNTMVEIRQNKFDRDSRGDGQIIEIGKAAFIEQYQ